MQICNRRLAPGSWSALFRASGIENPEVVFRLIVAADDPAAAHLEREAVDPLPYPYPMLAAVTALVLAELDQ